MRYILVSIFLGYRHISSRGSAVQSPHRWGARSCSRGCLWWPGGSRGAAAGTAAGSRRSARRRRGEQPAQQAEFYVTITTVLQCCSNISGNMSQPPQIYVAMCVNVLLQLQGELINFCVVSTHVTLGDKSDKATKIACNQIFYLKVCIETLLVGYFRESILCFDKNSLDDVSFTVQKGCNVFCIKGCKKF